MNGTTRRPWAPRRCRRTIDGGRPRLAWISDDRDDGRKCPCLRCRREPALEGTRHWGHPISSGGLARRCLVVDVRRPNLLPALPPYLPSPFTPTPPPPQHTLSSLSVAGFRFYISHRFSLPSPLLLWLLRRLRAPLSCGSRFVSSSSCPHPQAYLTRPCPCCPLGDFSVVLAVEVLHGEKCFPLG